MTLRRFVSGILILIWLIAISGCGRSPDTIFYTLTALAPEPASSSGASLSVSVGPVTLPDLVDRPQLVIRVAKNRVELLDAHRWAEPLRSEIPRLMAQNLSRLLHSTRVFVYDQNTALDAQYRVLIDIQRFESQPDKGVTIEALWSIRREPGDKVMHTSHSLVHQPVENTGYDAVAAAYSRALAIVCGDIAKILRNQG